MASRTKTAVDPPMPHFRAEGRVGALGKGRPDYMAATKLYRRRVVDVQAPAESGAKSGTRWFIGARSGLMLGFNEGIVTATRNAEDITGDGIDGGILHFVLSGRYRVMADGRDETFEPGDIFLEDSMRPRTSVSEFSSGCSIFIPRERFAAAIPGANEHLTLTSLSKAPLAPLLLQQVRFLVDELDRISADEFGAALDAAVDVALALLRKQTAREHPPEDSLLRSAKAFIEAHFRDVDLAPDAIAREVGCSRAVLYRAFASARLTVSGHLREVRFRHFLDALRAGGDLSISQLSYDCGFAASPSAFAKLFKRAFGVTPREARLRLSA